jgi:peptide/nickel transport system permease protein
MLRFLLGRLALTIPTLFFVAIAVFALIHAIPGDPAEVMLGDVTDPSLLARLRQDMGLDRPLPVQFALWLGRALSGDLGHSIVNGEPVAKLVFQRFQVSAVIVGTAVLIATCVSVIGGLIAAWRQNSAGDLAIVTTATILLSVPSFWLGLLLLMLFGVKLGWLPVVGYVPFAENLGQGLSYVVLPIATLAIVETGVLTRMMRASAIDVLRLEYVTHARAKGLPEWRVLLRHVLPNAFAPTWTLVGLILGHLLGGIAVLETVFTLPGLGRLMVDSILARDYPVVQGCLLFTALVYVGINLLVDLCYPIFDPRVAAR